MTRAESLSVYNGIAAAFPDAVVGVAVVMDAATNAEVKANGLRLNKTTARALAKGGLSENVDMRILVPVTMFTDSGYSVSDVRGRSVRVGTESVYTSHRITATVEHALGALVWLILGEFDRVTQ